MAYSFAGISSSTAGSATAGRPLVSADTFSLGQVETLLGDSGVANSMFQLNPKFEANITKENIYELYNGRSIKKFSQRMYEAIVLKNGQFLLQLVSPITLTEEQNFEYFRTKINFLPHHRVPPGGIPQIFTTARSKWRANKQSRALMGGCDLRSALDPNFGSEVIDQIIYGESVSAVYTLMRLVLDSMLRQAYMRSMIESFGNPQIFKNPQEQLLAETLNFAIAARSKSQFFGELRNKLKVVLGDRHLIILWPGGRTWIQQSTPMQTSNKFTGWTFIQDPETMRLVFRDLDVVDGVQIISGTESVGYAEVPSLRLRPDMPEDEPFVTSQTLAEYYVERQIRHLNDRVILRDDKSAVNATDVAIYSLPVDHRVALNQTEALYNMGIWEKDPSKTGDIYHPRIKALLTRMNQNPQSPPESDTGALATRIDNVQLNANPTFFDVYAAGDVQSARSRNLFLTWNPKDGQYEIPRLIGSIERQLLPHSYALSSGKKATHLLARASPRFSAALQALKTFTENVSKSVSAPAAERAWVEANYADAISVAVDLTVTFRGALTPDKVAQRHRTGRLLEWPRNSYGGINLPNDALLGTHKASVNNILAVCGNVPMMRTIAAVRDDSAFLKYKDIAVGLSSMLEALDAGVTEINNMFLGNKMCGDPLLRSPWFHVEDASSTMHENFVASAIPVFMGIPNPVGGANALAPAAPVGEDSSVIVKDIKVKLFDLADVTAAAYATLVAGNYAEVLSATSTGLSDAQAAVRATLRYGKELYDATVVTGGLNKHATFDRKVLVSVEAMDVDKFLKRAFQDDEVKLKATEAAAQNLKGQARQVYYEYLLLRLIVLGGANKDLVEKLLKRETALSKPETLELAKAIVEESTKLSTLKVAFGGPDTLIPAIFEARIKNKSIVSDVWKNAKVVLPATFAGKIPQTMLTAFEIAFRAWAEDLISTGTGTAVDAFGLDFTKGDATLKDAAKDALAVIATAAGTGVTADTAKTTYFDFMDVESGNKSVPDFSFGFRSAPRYARSPLVLHRAAFIEIHSRARNEKTPPLFLAGDKDARYMAPILKKTADELKKLVETTPVFAGVRNQFNASAFRPANVHMDLEAQGYEDVVSMANQSFANIDSFAETAEMRWSAVSSRPSGSSEGDVRGFSMTAAAYGSEALWHDPRHGDALHEEVEEGPFKIMIDTANFAQVDDLGDDITLSGPWHKRLAHDFVKMRPADAVSELCALAYLLTPTTLQASQRLTQVGLPLYMDILYVRPQMSFRMYNAAIVVPGCMRTYISDPHVRAIIDTMIGELYLQSWIDAVAVVEQEDKLMLLHNVAPAGYMGGMNARFMDPDRYNEELNLLPISRPSVIATFVPVTEELEGPIHLQNQSISTNVSARYSVTNTLHSKLSTSKFLEVLWEDLFQTAAQDEMASKTDKPSDDFMYRKFSACLLAFPGPHLKRNEEGGWSLVNGTGPLGHAGMQTTGAKEVWEGATKEFPEPRISSLDQLI